MPLLIFPFEIGKDPFPIFDIVYQLRNKGITVLCVWEDYWNNKNELIRQKIQGETKGRKRIFGRNCEIHTLHKKEADAFFEANHLLGSARAKYRYGLFYRGQLIAAAAFSGMRNIERGSHLCRSAEWVRYASLPLITVIGGMGKMLSAFVLEHKPDDVMSYADKEWSEGATYTKLGFERAGETPVQAYWLDTETLQRYPQKRYPVPQPQWKQVYGLGSLKFVKFFSNTVINFT